MKKRVFARVALFLIVSILSCMVMSACTTDQPVASETPAPPVIEVTPPAQLQEIPQEVEEPVAAEPDGGFSETDIESLNRMHAVYDSYARALSATGTRMADTSDPMFVWTVLNYMCANYAKLHPLAEKTDTQYMLPGSALREFADACFFGIEELPELPRQTFDITYDAENDQYFIGMMEGSDEYAQRIDYRRGTGGNPEALIAWLCASEQDDERMLAAYFFDLVPNENAGAVEPLFEYSVTSVYESYTDLIRVKSITERDGNQYATVDMVDIPQGLNSDASALEMQEIDLTKGGLSFSSGAEPVVVDEDVELVIAKGAEFTFSGIARLFPEAENDIVGMSARDCFIKYAPLEAGGEQLYFYVNILDGVLHGGALMS